MRFTWFNLMPWPYLPDDFREKHRSVWVDIDSRLFDPVKSHEVYNTYMDLLEYAGTLGFDGIGVNEHHQNGYGLMPSPNIIAAGLARRAHGGGAGRARQLDRTLQPAGPRRRGVRDARLHLAAGRLVAGFPVGTSMDTNYCYGQIPSLTREKYQRSARFDHAGLARAASPSPSTAATTSCVTSISGRGRSSNRIRRFISPAAARSRPMISASTTPIPTPTSASPAISAPRR